MIAYRLIKNHLGELVKAEERLYYKKGQVVFYEGHQPYGLYVVREGEVVLTRSKDGKSGVIAILGPGDLLGVEAFLSDTPYKENATADTDLELSFFGKAIFEIQ